MNPPTERIELAAGDSAAGSRIDAWLGAFPEIGSRAAAAKLIAAGRVRVDGAAATKSQKLAGGETIVVEPAAVALAPEAPAVEFSTVFEDADIIVVDKPAGLVVHPAPGNRTGTLSQALAGRAGGGDPARPGIVHRLDKDTSGLLVVARNDAALRNLQGQLARRDVHREYLALVRGRPESSSGTIDAPLGRDRRNPENIAVRADSERPAVTHFEIAEELPERTLLRVRLETGRTHQIRVHLAAIGLPVCGDDQYGAAGDLGLSRQFLHACELSFDHPRTGERMVFDSPLPADLTAALSLAREP